MLTLESIQGAFNILHNATESKRKDIIARDWKGQATDEEIEWLDGPANLTDEAQILYKLQHNTGTFKDTFQALSKKENTVLQNMFAEAAKICPPKANLGVQNVA